MRAAVIYFSGTGNTEFAARQFKIQFEKHNTECSLLDISRKRNITDNYNILIFGCPVYAGSFTEYYTDCIINNIINGNSRKCIVFSTSAGSDGIGIFELSDILSSKGFDVLIKAAIRMPNNYHINSNNKPTDDEKRELREKTAKKIEGIVEEFINDQRMEIKISEEKLTRGRETFKKFKESAPYFAVNNLYADMNACVKCGKCAKNCPTHNININVSINFKDKCICCQRCILGCPVNAIKFNKKS
jgi:flavodoxin/Pyruvate/2-oxoacid:ferredoxin oxidoreductase delta subunit